MLTFEFASSIFFIFTVNIIALCGIYNYTNVYDFLEVHCFTKCYYFVTIFSRCGIFVFSLRSTNLGLPPPSCHSTTIFIVPEKSTNFKREFLQIYHEFNSDALNITLGWNNIIIRKLGEFQLTGFSIDEVLKSIYFRKHWIEWTSEHRYHKNDIVLNQYNKKIINVWINRVL